MTPNELFDLSDRVAIITGGAGGIGTVYARALCEAGASVVLADLNLDAAEAAAAALTADGHAASGTAVDVRSTASAEAMAAHAAAVFGGVDILVNNAAIMTDLPPYGLSDIPDDQWDRVMNVNFRGPLLCTQAAIPHMQARGGGRVVNGLSSGGFMPGGIYGVSKYALHGLTLNLAAELGGRNITVNAIAPGLVDNDSGYASLPKDSPFRDAIAAQIPGKPSGPPSDLVGVLLLLCSAAGEWITGQSILVDGGWNLRF
ncbi:MAG: SDR family oxidoreductase [Acidimicrobiales bacterium]|nr:SDR family oxidoreductase [Acidimicrobiales bacterium]